MRKPGSLKERGKIGAEQTLDLAVVKIKVAKTFIYLSLPDTCT